MTEVVVVTSAQQAAAQAVVEWSDRTGRPVSDSVRKIANARLVPVNGNATETVVVTSAQRAAAQAMVERSAVTGRQVAGSVRKIANARLVHVGNRRLRSSFEASTQSDDPS